MNELYTDGGVKQLSPANIAIDLGADEIDIIITAPKTRIKKFIHDPSILDILKRITDLPTDKIMANDIDKVEMYNKMANAGLTNKKFIKVNIIRPEYNLVETILDFNPTKIKEMIDRGYNDAKNQYNQ